MTDDSEESGEKEVLQVAATLDQIRISPDLLFADFFDVDLFSKDFPINFSSNPDLTADTTDGPTIKKPKSPTSPSRKRGADPRSMEMNPHKQNTIAGGYDGPSSSFRTCVQPKPFDCPSASCEICLPPMVASCENPKNGICVALSSTRKRTGEILQNTVRVRARLHAMVKGGNAKPFAAYDPDAELNSMFRPNEFSQSNKFGIVRCFRSLGGSLLERLAAFGMQRGHFILALGLPWKQILLPALVAAVRSVTFRKRCYDEHVRSLVSTCPSLMRIKLSRCNGITDASLRYLSTCRQLQTLDISFCRKITDVGLRALACPSSLHHLNLSGNQRITGAGLIRFLGRCDQLRCVNLSYCRQVTDNVLGCLAKCLELRDANFTDCANLTDRGLVALTSQHVCTGPVRRHHHHPAQSLLRTISLYNCKQITDTGVGALTNCEHLRNLDLFNCCLLSDSAIRDLARHCVDLRVISLRRCSNITGACLEELATLTHLQVLDLSFCARLQGVFLNQLSKCARLHTLKLAHCSRVTRADLQAVIAHCPIRTLDVSGCDSRLSQCTVPPWVNVEAYQTIPKDWGFIN